MKAFLLLLCIGLCFVHTDALGGKRGDKLADLIKSKVLGKKDKSAKRDNSPNESGGSAADAIRSHRERKEKPAIPGRSLGEIGKLHAERNIKKDSSFGEVQTIDRFELMNKRNPRKIIDNINAVDDDKEEMDAATDDDDEEEEAEAPHVKTVNNAKTQKIKAKRPYTYKIVQDAAEIASWKQTKIYMIVGMFLFIFGVIGVSYYRGKNKMLLPGKLM